ncbi:MAG: AzlC family ABC transporter permease [Erysipelotrichaceae bacterium]|nr:AzlC family ABC transporter permease [Erysipelotrichaceae bacterium]
MEKKLEVFKEGMQDAIPIALGYFAVSFSLGITARHLGMTPFQGFMISLLNNASAGEYVAFTMIAAQATVLETVLATVVTNARYLLMSAALAQKVPKHTTLFQRMLIAYDVTDELFGLGIAKLHLRGPWYMYGAYCCALPGWAFGTALGVIAGNILPGNIVSALSVALYGMFIAIVIPPAKKDKVVFALVVISFLASTLWQWIPFLSRITIGNKTILLTVLIAGIASLIAPHKEDEYDA